MGTGQDMFAISSDFQIYIGTAISVENAVYAFAWI